MKKYIISRFSREKLKKNKRRKNPRIENKIRNIIKQSENKQKMMRLLDINYNKIIQTYVNLL